MITLETIITTSSMSIQPESTNLDLYVSFRFPHPRITEMRHLATRGGRCCAFRRLPHCALGWAHVPASAYTRALRTAFLPRYHTARDSMVESHTASTQRRTAAPTLMEKLSALNYHRENDITSILLSPSLSKLLTKPTPLP